jgi:hypothetical protein
VAGKGGIVARFGPVSDRCSDQENCGHRSEERPALLCVVDHLAERVGKRGGNGEDREALHEVGESCRVFERMSRVRVEESAAVRPQLLDGLRRDRPWAIV